MIWYNINDNSNSIIIIFEIIIIYMHTSSQYFFIRANTIILYNLLPLMTYVTRAMLILEVIIYNRICHLTIETVNQCIELF